MAVKIKDILEEENIALTAGEYLVSYTHADGYTDTHSGKYVFKIEEHNAGGLQIVPVTTAKGGKEFLVRSTEPIIVQEVEKVTYVYNTQNEAYQGNKFRVEDVPEGKEHRYILLAFLEFVKDEFSLGVNDFVIEGSGYTGDATVEPEPEPED